MFHALLLAPESFDGRAADAPVTAGGVAVADAIFLPQFAAGLPFFVRARAMVQDLNTQHAPAAVNPEGGNMNTTQPAATFTRSVYRDFALFALAAVGVGLAISLTLATAIVLAAPDDAAPARHERAAAGPRVQRTQFAQNATDSLQPPRAKAPAAGRSPS
jgi:hypothetical protein